MSIETILERIAAALDKQNAISEKMLGGVASAPTATQTAAPAKTPKAPKAAPAADNQIDMGGDAPPPAAEKEIDQQTVRENLRDFTVAMGKPAAILLAKKYGAKEPVLVTDIPAKNYAKLIAEIKETLAEKKGDI